MTGRARRMPACHAALLAGALLAAGPLAIAAAHAEPPAAVRLERTLHGQSERLVLRMRRDPALAVRQDGDHLILDLPSLVQGAPPALPTAPPGSAWVRGVQASVAGLRLKLAPGARPRLRQLADRIVIDVDDTQAALQPGQFRPAILPLAQPAAPQPATPPIPGSTAVPPPAAAPAPPRAAALDPPPAAPDPAPAPLAPPAPEPAASAILVPDDGTRGGPSVLLPAGHLTGAAAFTRGGNLHVVLDTPRLLDLSQLKDDAVFGAATERLLPDAAELRLRPPPGTLPALVRQDAGWLLTLGSTPGHLALVTGRISHGTLALAAAAPGRVVAVEDEATGGRLLVGTQRAAGQRVVAGHRGAEWALLPSWQGVVVQPWSDRVALLGHEDGFELLAAAPPRLALQWPDAAAALGADGRAMTRRFDLPGLPEAMLRRRLAEALRDAATAPLPARTIPRLRVAEAMLACGLDAEAASVLQVAAADDPAVMRDPAWQGLGAVATWLQARAGGAPAPAPGFDTATLGDSDEAVLWRALLREPVPDQARQAALVAGSWRLLLAYPDRLRRAVLPAVADLLQRGGGQDAALGELLAADADPALDLTRAALLARQGHAEESLRVLDRVGQGPDRLARALAREAAVEQRLAAGRLGPVQAADLLDAQLYAWRGGARELRLRLRVAALRARAGAWRPALALLRETATLYPEDGPQIHTAQVGVVSTLLHGEGAAALGALDLMALADAAATLLQPADADAALAPLLADRLLALDLPARAEPILRRLLDRAGDGPAKPALGLRLAGLAGDRGDGPGALAMLDRTEAPADPDLAERRLLLRANLLLQAGQGQTALPALAALTDQAGVEMQATIKEAAHDWPGAVQALTGLAASSLPAPARRAAVLRAARDASAARDAAALAALRQHFAALFATGPDAGLFAVLTAAPVRQVDDLPRAGRELGAIRALPAALRLAAGPT